MSLARSTKAPKEIGLPPPTPSRPLDPPTLRFITWIGAVSALLVLWWSLATLVVPRLIERSHGGETVPILSRFMGGRETTPLEAYLRTWADFSGGITLLLVLCVLLSLALVFTLPRVSARLEHSGPAPRPSPRTVGGLYAGGMLLLALVVVALSYVAPVAYIYAITEDYWVEHATFVAFMLAGAFFLWAAVLEPDYRRLGPMAFALAAFFVGMEEVSWGQRIVGFETPELLEAYNYQGELTLHNIWFPRHTVVGTVVMLFGVLVPALARRWTVFGGLMRRMAVPLPRPLLQPLFLVAGALLVYSNYQPSFMKLDEVGELALGVAVLLLGLDLAMEAGRGRAPGPRAALFSGTGTLAAVVVATGILVSLAPHPPSLTWRLQDFADHRFPEAGMHSQALALFQYMDENPELRLARTHLEYGRLLLELGDTSRAHQVLNQALESQQRRLAEHPTALPEVRRIEAEAHELLGRPTRADRVLDEALAADSSALAHTDDPAEKAELHWSLALSSEVAGRHTDAFDHATAACRLTENRVLHDRIQHWALELREIEDSDERLDPCEQRRDPM